MTLPVFPFAPLDALIRRVDPTPGDPSGNGGTSRRTGRRLFARMVADRFGTDWRSEARMLERSAARGWASLKHADKWAIALDLHPGDIWGWDAWGASGDEQADLFEVAS